MRMPPLSASVMLYCDTSRVNMITQRPTEWLPGGGHPVWLTRQRNESRSGRREKDYARLSPDTQNGIQPKTYELFISGTFHELFFQTMVDCG